MRREGHGARNDDHGIVTVPELYIILNYDFVQFEFLSDTPLTH